MKVYLDDVRNCKEGFTVARNYKQCIDYLNTGKVKVISLDHDLGEEKTGYDVAKYIVENNIYPEKIFVHTANPVGRDNIVQLIRHYMPDNVTLRW